MTEVAVPRQHRHARSVGNMLPTSTMAAAAAQKIEMTPNPDFSFPRLPPPVENSLGHSTRSHHGRPLSLSTTAQQPWMMAESSHKRTASMLPSFSFNAADSTGLQDEPSLDQPMEASLVGTPSRGHRRQNSEFVGGVGVTAAISSSPTRMTAMPLPSAPPRHRHVRSFAASSHDLSKIMSPPEAQSRLSSSLPSTPLEHPMHATEAPLGDGLMPERAVHSGDPFGQPLEPSSTRPPSSRGRQVGFSDNVEYIPRPLSTISSETESSLSTARGHSVNNSISSVLSLSTPSPPSFRSRPMALEPTMEDESKSGPRSSLELGKRIDKEGDWLRNGTREGELRRPSTEPTPESSKISFASNDGPIKSRFAHRKIHSVGRTLGSRRKSEPAIGMLAGEASRLSALSLQEPASLPAGFQSHDTTTSDRRSSTRKIKDWAASKISRKTRPKSEVIPASPDDVFSQSTPVAETNLDAVFLDGGVDVVKDRNMPSNAQMAAHTPSLHHKSSFSHHTSQDSDEGPMLDLDTALGPFNIPAPLGPQKPQRKLHSNRRTMDFVGPGLHYQPMHERTMSAPIMIPFEQTRTSTPPQNLEVFDEEDEHEVEGSQPARPSGTMFRQDEGALGVSVVDEDATSSSGTESIATDGGLGIQRSEWELEQPITPYAMSTRLSTPVIERRCSSIIEQTILEEASPVDSVAVNAEESRAQSLTKSSDSSEAPTIMASQSMLALPDAQQTYTTPETFNSSVFSSPDLARRHSSFDTSRVGTSTSSIADNRTVSSCTTGSQMQEIRLSTDDIPSLTSSRSTMISTTNANCSRRDVSGLRTPSVASGSLDAAAASERRRKRTSIQSLSQLVGSPFGPRSNNSDGLRPQTATDMSNSRTPKKKEHRLKKLMFWKSKHRQASASTVL